MTAGDAVAGNAVAELAVIGGSGFTALLDDVERVTPTTPWGEPSGPIDVGTVEGRRVAFLARHGAGHRLPPHRIPYRANLWALRELGVAAVLGPCASGSLRPDVHPGDLVVCDQLVDATKNRDGTYFDGPTVNHISLADPYCPELRAVALAAASDAGWRVHGSGTVAVIEGPRFATRAESRIHRAQGCDVINMTQAPEAALARELGLCYSAIALVTDYDTGADHDPSLAPVSQSEVFAFFEQNLGRLRTLLVASLAAVPTTRSCGCAEGPAGLAPDPPSA